MRYKTPFLTEAWAVRERPSLYGLTEEEVAQKSDAELLVFTDALAKGRRAEWDLKEDARLLASKAKVEITDEEAVNDIFGPNMGQRILRDWEAAADEDLFRVLAEIASQETPPASDENKDPEPTDKPPAGRIAFYWGGLISSRLCGTETTPLEEGKEHE